MYAMTGKFPAQPGKRDALVQILLRASEMVAKFSECRAYIVLEDLHDEACVWVYEVWDSKEAQDASLQDEQVRALIAEARPILGGAPNGAELQIVGGFGATY